MSLNIGDIAVTLTEKDSQRLTLRNELNKLEDVQASGSDRLLRVTATGVKKEGLSFSKAIYSYSIDHTSSKHNGKAEGEIVEFLLLSDNDVINIIVDVVTTDASEGSANITFLAQFPTSRVPTTSQADNVVEVSPEDATPEEPATTVTASEWINVSLEAVDGDDADSKAELNVMAKRIAIAEAIAEKTAQLEKAVAEIAQIQNLLKEAQAAMVKEQKSAAASKASTATKKKASVTAAKRKVTMSKTAKKSAKSNSVADEDDDDDITDKQQAVQKKSSFEIPSLATVQTYVVNGGFMALNLTLAHRAVVFFGLAAAGVYAYGDYASV